MIGKIHDHTLAPGCKMIHNAVAMLSGNEPAANHIHFYWDKDNENNPEPVFVPKTARTEKGDYYWLGDGFVDQVNREMLFIFLATGYVLSSTGALWL